MYGEDPSVESSTALTPDREMLVEMCSLVARVLRRMPYIEFVLAAGIGLFVYRFVPPWLFLGWACVTVGVETERARYASGVLRRGDAIDPRRTHRVFVVHAGLAGFA